MQQCLTVLADADLLIQLSNVSPDIFPHLLYNMYGGKIEDAKMKLHTKEIIDAADLYGVVNQKLNMKFVSWKQQLLRWKMYLITLNMPSL